MDAQLQTKYRIERKWCQSGKSLFEPQSCYSQLIFDVIITDWYPLAPPQERREDALCIINARREFDINPSCEYV